MRNTTIDNWGGQKCKVLFNEQQFPPNLRVIVYLLMGNNPVTAPPWLKVPLLGRGVWPEDAAAKAHDNLIRRLHRGRVGAGPRFA